ncbi:DNA-processing protein DprA [Bacillus weihaiensis]|uniref:DNA protecting protein DprA n=1 Tax=Bacillus weihaiensis TaxID=1547283 RepID=A0A1L3MSE8_9BACI|nr:DNA-processing protein DprA [Bacillus weihaiensis]APH05271.1 DNA protecting protein DprA [Bacillus weihaiensis]
MPKKDLLLLSHCPSMNQVLLKKLLLTDPTLKIFHDLENRDWFYYFKQGPEKIAAIKKEYKSLSYDGLIRMYRDKMISIVTIFDEMYPYLLKEISDPPPVLYYKGDLKLGHSPRLLSVVGTRNPTHYGKVTSELLIPTLVKKDWTIVSGLAIGIDTVAHEVTIQNGGKTIAVIAGGLDHIYPKQNESLAKEIMNSHLIISEHPPHIKPSKWHFPMRNRIISGISLGTIVIQAKRKSGSLITAQQALEQNREVFAVPGPIYDDNCRGTNELIQLGAKLVQTPEDILNEIFVNQKIF